MARRILLPAGVALCAFLMLWGSVWIILQDPINSRVFIAASGGVVFSTLCLIGAVIALVVTVGGHVTESSATDSGTTKG